jgi:CheY-like chemotaxis protein
MKILIVEENEVDASIIDLMMQKYNFETIRVSSDKKALEYLESNSDIRLVITDISLPEIDGLDLLVKIKDDPKLGKIPIIVYTSTNDPITMKSAATIGCTEYIVKPIDTDELIKKVQQALT